MQFGPAERPFYQTNLNAYEQFGSSLKCQIGPFCATPSICPLPLLINSSMICVIKALNSHYISTTAIWFVGMPKVKGCL